MPNSAKRNRIISTLYWHIGRFEVLVGVAILTAASAIMALSLRRRPIEDETPAWRALNSGVYVIPAEAG